MSDCLYGMDCRELLISRSNSSINSGIVAARANSATHRRTRTRSIVEFAASKASMSSRSRGRCAMAFMINRSSTRGRRIVTSSSCTSIPCCTASVSNGKAPRMMSTSIRVGECRSRRTRAFLAKSSGFSTRTARWKSDARVSASAQADSGNKINASMSWVNLGRPRSEAATPPTTTAGAGRAFSQPVNARSAATSGDRRESDTVMAADIRPAARQFAWPLRLVLFWLKQRSGTHQRSQLRESGLKRYTRPLTALELRDDGPAFQVLAGLN